MCKNIKSEVVSLITRILAAVQMNRINAPYTNITCQIKLYEVLISLFKQECKKIDLPVHLITSMLHRGLKSVNYKISETSREGLDLFEKISHPVCASLYIDDSLSQYKKNKMVNSNLNEIECENCNNSNEESLKEVTQDLQLLIQKPVTSVDTKEINILMCKRHTADNEEMKGEESEQSLKGKDIDIIPQISEVKMENNLTGPPKKKTKTKDNTLETMFYSFQDVIQ
ncbi:hypothetical protein BDFB_007090 [Asbolus verrucosus]|uniref:Uncharacterized protein n=1 Tax=Asbolus verrucosus TaxID=1661398 RepID=A0A482WBC7_ASBVE|nr:hypothetical protein BDFB_007090 [Asbolus verrucosus]